MTHLKLNNRPVAKYSDIFNDFFSLTPAWGSPQLHTPAYPAANIYETQQAYFLELNVPGRTKEDFKINLEKDLLTISFENKVQDRADMKLLRREFSFNNFKRSFTVTDNVDTSGISAKYENGLLKIELPKKE